MRKLIWAASLAAMGVGLASPAVAAEQTNYTSVTTGSQPSTADLNAVCQSLLRPNARSGFMTKAVDVTTTNTNHQESSDVGDLELLGTPEPGEPEAGAPFVNGGNNYNVFVQYMYTSQTYPDSQQTTHYTVVDDYTASFGCKVWKVVRSGEVVPPDQQASGLTSGSWTVTQEWDETEHLGPQTVPLDEPVPAGDADLVCHYQNDAWTAKNGYAGDCSYDAYVGAGGTNPDPALDTGPGGGNGGGGGNPHNT